MSRACLFVLALIAVPAVAQENLLPNGGFERDADNDGLPDGWDREFQQQNTGAIERDTAVFAEGVGSLRVEHPDDNNVWVRSSRQDMVAQPKTLYRLDAKVRSTGSYSILLYEFTPDSSDQAYLTHTIASGRQHDEWRSLGAVVMTTELARSFKVSCLANGKGTVWFDDLRLIKVGSLPDGEAVAVDQPPTVDGVLDDAGWREAPEMGPFYLLGATGERPTAATTVRAVWTTTTLYLAFRCEEPDPAHLKMAVTEDDGPVYNDDAVEVFLDPQGTGTGFGQLAVNAAGKRFDTRHLPTTLNLDWYHTSTGGGTIDWDPQWTAAAKVGEAEWTVELALPFEAFGGAPQAGDAWGANFCRERQVEAELSTWSLLPGDTFHQPDRFGRLIFSGGAVKPPELLERPAEADPTPLPLVPRPKEIEPGDGDLTLPGVLLLRPADDEAARYAAACAKLIPSCELRPDADPKQPGVILATTRLKLPILADLPLVGRLFTGDLGREGYQLTIADDGIVVLGADALGVRNGLMSLAQLVRPVANGLRLPKLAIRDRPDCAVRAWHVGSPMADEGEAFENWVATLARLKYNTIMLEVNDHFPYESHPEIASPNAPTKAQLKEWVQYAKELGFDVIPQVQVYGHFNWVLNKPGWADLAENPEPDARQGRWNANIRDPRYYPLVFDLYQEVIDVFGPTTFHIGHDEITFRPIGIHAATRDSKPHELLAEEVTKLHDWLTAKGLKVMMWGDQLLQNQHGGRPYDTYLATDLLPNDIVMADWHYGPTDQYPSVAYFKEHGFPVVACGWWDPLNMINFSNTAVDEEILGFSGTSWWALSNFANSAEHETAFVLAAENSWSNRNPTIDALPYEPMDVWRRLAGWGGPPAERRFATVDLSRQANQTLSDTRRKTGWLGLGPDQDFSRLPRGVQWWGGVPYRILDGDREVVMLAAEGDPPRAWPTSVRAVPVGTKAKALYFAHVCSAPPRRWANIYDRGRNYPRLLGRYQVHHDDGSTEELPVEYRLNLTDWNAGLPPAHAPTIWAGQTNGGARAQLAGWRWDNPQPDKVITSLDLISTEASLRVAVVAITAAVE